MSDSMITMYHGTNAEGAEGIAKEGFWDGNVFLSPRQDVALAYAGEGGVAIPVSVPKSALRLDFDLPGAKVLTVDEANGYRKTQRSIDEWITDGQSFAVDAQIANGGGLTMPRTFTVYPCTWYDTPGGWQWNGYADITPQSAVANAIECGEPGVSYDDLCNAVFVDGSTGEILNASARITSTTEED